MEYLAQLSGGEVGTIFGLMAGMLGGFYALLKYVLEQHGKATEADRNERKELSHAINRMATASEKAAQEAEKRNGHLAELQIEARKDVLDAISHISKQEVSEQVVKHQTVKEQE